MGKKAKTKKTKKPETAAVSKDMDDKKTPMEPVEGSMEPTEERKAKTAKPKKKEKPVEATSPETPSPTEAPSPAETPSPVEAPSPVVKEPSQVVVATPAELPMPVEVPSPAEPPSPAEAQSPEEAPSPEEVPSQAEVPGKSAEAVDVKPSGIHAILGTGSDEDAKVDEKSLRKYLDYLKESVELPCLVKATGPFGWEKVYVWRLRDQGEYGKLKEKNPSFTDEFEIAGFDEDFNEADGILVRALRTSDRREFVLSLAELKAVDESSKNSELLDAYSSWFADYR